MCSRTHAHVRGKIWDTYSGHSILLSRGLILFETKSMIEFGGFDAQASAQPQATQRHHHHFHLLLSYCDGFGNYYRT